MSIFTMIKLAFLTVLNDVDEMGAQPIVSNNNSHLVASRRLPTGEQVVMRQQLRLLSTIPLGQLSMLESTDYDLNVIGDGTAHMTVR